jgi:hypothetical protein
MLSLVFGSDRIPSPPPPTTCPACSASFPSFSAAADEAGESRIYGGIHWGHADKDGAKAGQQLARYVFQHHLKKLTGASARTGAGDRPRTKGQGQGQGKGQGKGRGGPSP